MSGIWRCLGVVWLAMTLVDASAKADQSVSEAEQRLFLDAHLNNVTVPVTLNYRYTKSGSLEAAVAKDEVRVSLTASEGGKQAHVDYLTGPRAISLPDLQAVTANPVILFFLEHDVREMQRLSSGKSAYFRKRVRVALAETAQVRPISIQLDGRSVDAVQISVRPYDQDPLQRRFAAYADKTYVFTLSPDVPGTVYEMRTTMFDPQPRAGGVDAAPALIEETLTFTGVAQ
jgi:hypothetical protein